MRELYTGLAIDSVAGDVHVFKRVCVWRHLSRGSVIRSGKRDDQTSWWRSHVIRRKIDGSYWWTSVGCVYRVDERLQRVFVESRIRAWAAWLRAWFVVRIWSRLHFDVRRSTSQRADVRAVLNDKSSTTTVRSSKHLVFWVRFHLCCF